MNSVVTLILQKAFKVHKVRLMSVKTKLHEKVSGLRAELSQLGHSVPTSDGVDPGGGARLDLDVIMDEVAGHLSEFEARTLGEGFSTGGHTFNSEESVMEYLIEEKVSNAGISGISSVFWLACPKEAKGKGEGRRNVFSKVYPVYPTCQ
jgi:hypothetical protein